MGLAHLPIDINSGAVLLDGLRDSMHIEGGALREADYSQLELALEDVGWHKLIFQGQEEFSRAGLQRIVDLCRLYAIKNPLILRGVATYVNYVWGKGVHVSSDDKQVQVDIEALQKLNKPVLGYAACLELQREFMVTGNLFFSYFIGPNGIKVRMIPFEQVSEIITNPDDILEPWYYKREWIQNSVDPFTGNMQSKSEVRYYPDWRIPKKQLVKSIAGIQVDNIPIYHKKSGGYLNWLWGVPKIYAALDWAKAYKEFLEDYASITKSYRQFAWQLISKTPKGVQRSKTKLNTTVNATNPNDRNPQAIPGSIIATSGGDELKPFKTQGATVSMEDGRRLLLMVAATMGQPETFFSDVSVGTLATAKSLDYPTQLEFYTEQQNWRESLSDMYDYMLDHLYQQNNKNMEDCKVKVNFDDILEHDIKDYISAVVSAYTMNGNPSAGLLSDKDVALLLGNALKIDNVEDTVDAMFDDNGQILDNMPYSESLIRNMRETRHLLKELGKLKKGED